MRQEVLEVIACDGWTKVSQGKMRRLDSFVKESQRMNMGVCMCLTVLRIGYRISDTVNTVNVQRKIMKDFTFSNGVTLPAGTNVAAAAETVHFDGVSIAYCF